MSLGKKNENKFQEKEFSIFNSKLFLDMELLEENSLSNNNMDDLENSIKNPVMPLKDYLSNDLIKELDLLTFNQENKFYLNNMISKDNDFKTQNYSYKYSNNSTEKENIKNNNINNIKNDYNLELNSKVNKFNSYNYNPLLPLINMGYEFIPRNLKNNKNENSYKINFEGKNDNIYRKNKKDDWFCSFCNNLNYSFRVKCNRCGASKEMSNFTYKKLLESQN